MKTETIEVSVVAKEAAAGRIDAIAADCAAVGLSVETIYGDVGIVSGTCPADAVESLKRIEGVHAVVSVDG